VLSSHRARSARKRILAACVEGHDQTTLMATVSPILAEAVPFDAAGWSACDPGTLLPTAFHTPNMPEEVCRAYFDNEVFAADVNKLSDLVRHRRPAGLLSEATRGELERSPRYRTMMAPYGHERELRVPFVLDDQCWGSVCFVRDGNRPDFDKAEVGWIAGVAKHIAQGFCGAVALANATREQPAPDGPGMLVVGDDCRVVRTTPEAERWLSEIDPGWAGPTSDVPVAVRSVVTRARAAFESGGGAAPPRLRVRTAERRWLVVHASRLSGPRPEWAVVLEPARPSEVLTLIALAQGLTPREQEVFGMLMRGLGDAEMAEQLVVSPHTQREHVKRVLQKFGVRNRTELVLSVYAGQGG
jgi:DNA-binding CsgD family transcriptional regulator